MHEMGMPPAAAVTAEYCRLLGHEENPLRIKQAQHRADCLIPPFCQNITHAQILSVYRELIDSAFTAFSQVAPHFFA